MGQAGRDGRDGRDGLAVLSCAWDRLIGMVGMAWLCCTLCVGQADRHESGGLAVLHDLWYLDGHGSCN